jgi:hypothetical protein
MIKIKVDTPPQLLTGGGFKIVDVTAPNPPMVFQCDHCGKTHEIVKPKFIENAGLVELLKTLIYGIPRQACTFQDAENAYDFMQQLNNQADPAFLQVTDRIHNWLLAAVEKHGTGAFGINAYSLKKALNDTDR